MAIWAIALGDAPLSAAQGSDTALKSALFSAIEQGNVESVRILLEAGVSPNVIGGLSREPALCTAVESTSAEAPEIVALMLRFQADTEVICSLDSTPLGMAARMGQSGIVDALIKAGANRHSTSSVGETAHSIAQFSGHTDIAEKLEEKGSPMCRLIPADGKHVGDSGPTLESPLAPGLPLTSAAISDDGGLLVLGGVDGTASLWDVASGRKVRTFLGHRSDVGFVLIDSKRQWLFSASRKPATVRATGLLDGRLRLEITNLDVPPWVKSTAALTDNYGTLVAMAGPRLFIAWRVSDCQEIGRVTVEDDVETISSSPSTGSSVAIAEEKGGVELWSPSTQKLTRIIEPGRPMGTIAVSADGSRLVTVSRSETPVPKTQVIDVWTVKDSAEHLTALHWDDETSTAIEALSLSPDGRFALAATDVEARVFDVSTGAVRTTLVSDTAAPVAAAFPGGKCFFVGGFGAAIVPVGSGDASNSTCRYTLKAMALAIAEPYLSADEKSLVVRTGRMLSHWNLDDGSAREIKLQLGGSKNSGEELTAVALDNTASQLYAGTSAGRVLGVDLKSDAIRGSKQAFSCSVDAMTIAADMLLAASGQDLTQSCSEAPSLRRLSMRDLSAMKPPIPISKDQTVTRIFGDPSGSLAYITIRFGDGIEAWNLSTGQQDSTATKLPLLSLGGTSIATLPDGRKAIGLSEPNFDARGVALWEPAGNKPPSLLTAPSMGTISDIAIDDRRRRIMGAGSNGQLYVWDIASASLVSESADYGSIARIAFNQGGRSFATGLASGLVGIWDQESLAVRAHLLTYYDSDAEHSFRWLVTTPDGRYDSNSPGDLSGVSWVLPSDPLSPLPVEAFIRDYYEPGLLRKALGQERLRPVQLLENLDRVQPEVRIVDVIPEGDGATVKVTVEVRQGHRKVGAAPNAPTLSTKKVQDLRVFRDGQLVSYVDGTLIGDESKQDGATALPVQSSKLIDRYDIKVPTDQRGKTVTFSAYAFNETLVKSLTAKKAYKVEGTFKAKAARAYVISIGLNEYQNASFNLTYAANDAWQMQKMLGEALESEHRYAEVVRVPLISGACLGCPKDQSAGVDKAHIRAVFELLAGHPVSAETKAQIPHADRLQQVNPEDLVLITYSGHGIADDAGNFYLFPYDIGPGAGRSTIDYQRLISSDDLTLWLRDVDARDMTMIIDACQSSASVDGNGFRPGPMGSRGLGQLAYDKGMRILAASQAESVALESSKLRHGVLTYALLIEGLRDSLADWKPKDGKIMEDEWLDYGVQRVPRLYKELASSTFNGRGFKPLNTSHSGRSLLVQEPHLFDFRPPGRPEIEIVH